MAGFFKNLFGPSADKPTRRVKRDFHTKIAGVSKKNSDGSSRQELLDRIRPGEQVHLVLEPENEFDKNAVRVENRRGQQLGYIDAEIAANLSGQLQRGLETRVSVSEITGGTKAKPTLGCNLLIEILE